MSWNYYPKYVSVAERREKVAKKITALKKKGQTINPIVISGRNIANTFWGKAWCKHLESYSDYENRLPRGRSYVRNGSIIDLNIFEGGIKANVQGTKLYDVDIKISPCLKSKWQKLVAECSGKIDSLIELLQGKFSKSVMEIITDKQIGLFPDLNEIKLNCSCPDYATMCKHVAAVLYGIGARLDQKPEELFLLRHVDHLALINSSSTSSLTQKKSSSQHLQETDLSALFDIEMDTGKAITKVKKEQLKKKTARAKSPKLDTGKTSKKKTVKKVIKKIRSSMLLYY
jgi:uncharacterized Zn finger protein